jgi:hypothetical protein
MKSLIALAAIACVCTAFLSSVPVAQAAHVPPRCGYC